MLDGLRKGFNRPSRYAEDFRRLREKGIQVIALMMLGMDGQDASVFERTVERLEADGVSLVKLFTPAPYPGTRFHEEMRAAGRIVEEDWARYDYGSLLIEPRGMTEGELRRGFDDAYKRFYGLRSIAKRMLPFNELAAPAYDELAAAVKQTLPAGDVH